MIKNQLLQQAEAAIRAKAKNIKGLDKVVQAGLGTIFSPGGAKLFKEQVTKPGDIVENAAEGAAKLMGHLFEQSKGTMPMDAMVPGGQIVLLNGLDFLEEAGKIKVDNDVVARATKAYSSYILQLLGVTPEKMNQMIKDRQGGASAAPGPGPTPAPQPGILNSAAAGGV